jgi:hypothetical protein
MLAWNLEGTLEIDNRRYKLVTIALKRLTDRYTGNCLPLGRVPAFSTTEKVPLHLRISNRKFVVVSCHAKFHSHLSLRKPLLDRNDQVVRFHQHQREFNVSA